MTRLKDGMLSRGTWMNSRSETKGISRGLTKPGAGAAPGSR